MVKNSAVQLILRCRFGLTVLLRPSILTYFPVALLHYFTTSILRYFATLDTRKVGFDTLKDLMK